jgi:hypothetical protein
MLSAADFAVADAVEPLVPLPDEPEEEMAPVASLPAFPPEEPVADLPAVPEPELPVTELVLRVVPVAAVSVAEARMESRVV